MSTITVARGQSHSATFKLTGSVQSQSTPPITMEELTGPVAFGFLVSADLKGFRAKYSPAFVLKPPI